MKILVVDDRKDARDLVRELLQEHLPDGTDTVVDGIFPLAELGEYASYIQEHEIGAIVLDEMLNEQRDPDSGRHAAYLGHDIVSHLRAATPDFPVFVVTSFRDEQSLLDKEAELEDIIERNEFQKSPAKYSARIHRSASRFMESMKEHLIELDQLALKAATGTLSEDEGKRLVMIRQTLGLPFSAGTDFVMSDHIANARRVIDKAEDLLRRLQARGDTK